MIESAVLDMPCQNKLLVTYLEIPNSMFHPDSAVPCIDQDGHLISELVTVTCYAHDFPDKELVLFGHTDQTGSEGYNYELSRLRSCAVKALLDGDETAWAEITNKRSRVKDYQQILKTLSTSHNWPCDPGAVDDMNGPQTEEGVESFQEMYNTKYNETITQDGKIGPQTWKAIFKTIRSFVETESRKLTAEDTLPEFSYGYNGKGVYPCGGSFPIEGTDPKDARNHRLEIVFYDRAQAPELLDHPDEDVMVTREENPVYDTEKTERRAIEEVPVSCHSEPTVLLDFVYPSVTNTDTPHKQYVNLDSNGTDEGMELTIKVRPRDLAQNVDESAVYWKVTAHEDNSARTDPKTGIKPYWTRAELREFNGGEVKCFTKFVDRESSIVLVCGVAGGDRFTVEVGSDGKNYPLRLEVENWRKLWYELQAPDFMELDSGDYPRTTRSWMKERLANVFVEYRCKNSIVFSKDDSPAINIYEPSYFNLPATGRADNLLYVYPGEGGTPKPFSPTHNQTVNVHLCDKAFSTNGLRKRAIGPVVTNLINGKFIYNVLNVYPRNNILAIDLSSFSWQLVVHPGYTPDTQLRMSGTNEGWTITNNYREITFIPPEDLRGHIGNNVEPKCSIQIRMKIKTSYEINGNSRGHQQVMVFKKEYPLAMACTICHELGHNMGMTILKGRNSLPPGLPFPKNVDELLDDDSGEYGYYYRNRTSTKEVYGSNGVRGPNHVGSHCAFGISRRHSLSNLRRQNGSCIMYGEGGNVVTRNNYCPVCSRYLKARHLNDIVKTWIGR
ncbi:hypothetical protein CHISP_2904 [Chitinispirillum alkaliphilum]|nr:hypothetical protein CHISP_2904 [Chitinispirillum alkaliphilum]